VEDEWMTTLLGRRVADAQDADLLVVGSRGRGANGADRWGSG
jgi:nucleotide-binding universal stress UspA family protein